MRDGACPGEEQLMPLAAADEEHAEPGVIEHVANCSACRQRLQQLQLEMSTLRGFISDDTGDTPLKRHGSDIEQRDRQSCDELPAAVGRYRVVGRIGRGGQGLVYRVVHPTLHKDLVLKLSRRPLDAAGLDRDRLSAEGRLLAELDHPNLARVYDLDVADDRPFLVLEYVRGRTLAQYLHDERPSPRQAARLLADVARALVPAHAAGVVHQDLKPSNILIDQQGRPRIIDFGMALLRGAWIDETGELDSIGGTFSYMPPEQARGEFENLGPACDIFALGAVLYHALLGSPPYSGESSEEVLRKARECDFDRDRLSAVGIPKALTRICLRAMSARPEDRQRSAEQLADELDRFARPRRWWPAAVGAAIVLVSGGLAAAFWPKTEPPPATFQYLVQAERGDRVLWVYEELPLRVDDRIRVYCAVPSSLKPSLFWFDSSGKLSQLGSFEIRQASSGNVARLAYPAGGEKIGLDATPGTEFVLVCAARGKAPQEKRIRELAAEFFSAGPLPALPGDVMVVLNHDAVEAQSSAGGKTPRGFTAPEKSQTATVEDRLERLRVKLQAEYPFVVGIAFPHR